MISNICNKAYQGIDKMINKATPKVQAKLAGTSMDKYVKHSKKIATVGVVGAIVLIAASIGSGLSSSHTKHRHKAIY